jgi:hypothetical protein
MNKLPIALSLLNIIIAEFVEIPMAENRRSSINTQLANDCVTKYGKRHATQTFDRRCVIIFCK